MRWLVWAVVALLGGCLARGQTTYYVSEDDGNDTRTHIQAQSSSTPWATINKAVQTCDGTAPITIYVIQPTDAVHSEPARILTDASCAGKAVTIEGYTTTPGDGTVGSTVVEIASGNLDGFVVNQASGTLEFKYLDLTNTQANGATDSLYNPQSFEVSVTFNSCILRRSQNQSTSGARLLYFQNVATPSRTLAFTDCQLIDYSAGAHTAGLLLPGSWASVTLDGCSFSDSPSGGIGYIAQLYYEVGSLIVTDCTSTITHNSENGFAFLFNATITGIDLIRIEDSTFADSAMKFDDADEGPGVTIFHDNTVTADGYGFYIGRSSGDPTTAYGTVSVVGNTFTITSEGAGDHGVATLKGVSGGEIAFNIITAAAGVEWPLVSKATLMDILHNVVSHASRIVIVAGASTVTNNTFVQTADNNVPCLDLYSNSAGPEDVWPEYCKITRNIFDAGSGSECIRIYDDSGTYDPPVGTYRTIVDENIYVVGADGLATIFGTDCADITELRAAWVTHTGSGTPPTNDANSSEEADAGFYDAAGNDFRIFRTSPAVSNDPNDFYSTKGAWNRKPGAGARRFGL